MGVGGQPELLARLGDVFCAAADELDAEAAVLRAAIDAFVASRSEFVGPLGDPSAILRSSSSSLRSLAHQTLGDAQQLRAADTGTLAPVRRAALPKLMTPGWPSSATSPASMTSLPKNELRRGGNWAGFDSNAIARGEEVAKRVATRPVFAQDLSDSDMSALSAWLWLRQHTYGSDGRPETNDVDDVYQNLTLHDQARLRSMLVLFDTNAYLRVKELRSVRTDEFMAWLATDDAKQLTPTQLAAQAKQRFGISSPEVLDATLTYIGYQLRGAYLITHPFIRPDYLVIHGWATPVVDVQPWAQSYVATTRLRIDQSPLGMTVEAMQSIANLLQGKVPKSGNEDLVRFDMLRASSGGSGDAETLAVIVVGLAVGALFVAATAGAGAIAITMIESALVDTVGSVAAGFIAVMVVGAFVEAGASALSGLSARATEALLGKREWDTVLDGDAVARDAIIGGLMGLASGGLTHGLQRAASRVGRATRETRKAQRALRAAKQSKRTDPAWQAELQRLTRRLDAAHKELRVATAEQDLLDRSRYALARQLQNETGAVTPGSWWRKLTGQAATPTELERAALDDWIRAALKKGKYSNPEFFDVAMLKSFPVELLDDARFAIRDAVECGMIPKDSIVGVISKLKKASNENQFQEALAELHTGLADVRDPARDATERVFVGVKRIAKFEKRTVDISDLGDVDSIVLLTDGTVRITETKNTFGALIQKLAESAQLKRLTDWVRETPNSRLVVHVDQPGDWYRLFDNAAYKGTDRGLVIKLLVDAEADVRIGSTYLTNSQLKSFREAVKAAAGTANDLAHLQQLSFAEALARLGVLP